jgi:hypothetical protein
MAKKDRALSATDAQQRALQTLIRAIASGDRPQTSRLLAESPTLAGVAISVGATRENPRDYFLDEIAHYAYAGDTALHIAAAAYQPETAKELLSKGANVRARNRRGAEPLHYAADGVPESRAWNPEAQYAVVDLLLVPKILTTSVPEILATPR